MTSNAVQRPQTSVSLRFAAAWARLRCSALHPGPRRSQPDPRDFHHGLLVHRCIDSECSASSQARLQQSQGLGQQ